MIKATGKWRVGIQVPINVYDQYGKPVCQCQSAWYAREIVEAVNAFREAQPKPGDGPKVPVLDCQGVEPGARTGKVTKPR